MLTRQPKRYQFGEFIADLSTGELYRNGLRISIQDKPFQFLAVLLESNGAVVTREELSGRMWPDTHVQVDQGLNAAARKVRLALGDDAVNPRFIETLGSRGYRFIAPYTVSVSEGEPQSARTRVTVLPFENRSTLSSVVTDGLTEELVSQLGRLHRDLDPITSSAGFSAAETSTVQRELDAAYTVRGKVEGTDQLVRLSAELLAHGNSSPMWSATFERPAEELPALQTLIAAQIGECLEQKISVTQEPAGRQVAFSVYENYLRGRYFWNKRTPAALHKSIEYLRLSITQDPNYALGHAGLADCFNGLATHGLMAPKTAFENAKEYANRALQMKPDLPQALVPLGWATLFLDYEREAARRFLDRAIELNPGYAPAYLAKSKYYLTIGDADASVSAMRRGRDLDPLSLPMNSILSICYYYAREYGKAARQAEAAIELDPQFSLAHSCAGLAYWGLGRKEEAIREFERAASFAPDSPIMNAQLAHALAGTGHERRALEIFEDLATPTERAVPPAYHLALVALALGWRDEALNWLERAFEDRFHWTLFLRLDPLVEALRGDARFERLSHRVNGVVEQS